DRKSRHRSIKKQRRYERLAATSFYPFVHTSTSNSEAHLRTPALSFNRCAAPDRPAEASVGSKIRGCYPASDSQSNRIPLVHTSSELAVRRPGKDPERAVPSPSPGRHEAVQSRHVSSSSSPPTVDGFRTGTPGPSP
ncbi:unnamed protein product, partial [Brassica napus]